ncbi:MAG: DUF6301 family protein [Arachnia propionica]|uniref:DUF6301 family protein n=1 Tax=Arachnia propionica TaxID=1750 RepID=UPI0026F5B40A|nr:DUF6301 family protein [Arachnia propionica]
MTMIPTDEVTRIATSWVDQPWPLGLDEAHRVCLSLGWRLDDDGVVITGHGLNHPQVTLVRGGEEVDIVSLRITDAMAEPTSDHAMLLNDAHTLALGALNQLWGKASVGKQPQRSHACWDLRNGCRVRLSNIHTSVVLHVYSPSCATVERTLAAH